MNNFIKRWLQKIRADNQTPVPGEYVGSSSNNAIAPAFNYTLTENTGDTDTSPLPFEGFDNGDFGGAGAGDSWSDSASFDNGDSGGGDSGGGDGGGGDGGGGSD